MSRQVVVEQAGGMGAGRRHESRQRNMQGPARKKKQQQKCLKCGVVKNHNLIGEVGDTAHP